ncbi:ParB-like nuclease domain protein [Gordonia phage CaiB]|nr:ParB-like nuclease domain protein [Gordonia phage CaiB]
MIRQRQLQITPSKAREILCLNVANRKIRPNQVAKLRAEMVQGRWRVNGDTIRISEDGVLLDGQHRLLALSGLPDDHPGFLFLIVDGLEMDAQMTMDQNVRRSVSDQLGFGDRPVRESTVVAGAVRFYIIWKRGGLFGNSNRAEAQASNPEVLEWIEDHPRETTIMGDLVTADVKRVRIRTSLVVAALFDFTEIDSSDAHDFIAALTTGVGLTEGSPILALRNRLERIYDSKTKLPDRDALGYLITAWNAYRSGRSMVKLQMPKGGKWTPDTFPVPR